MPLDHYVSQVHLNNFASPILGNRMYAIRKSDLKAFTPTSQAVCRIEDGSTNAYLRDSRVIEEFLKGVEPRYNQALANFASGSIVMKNSRFRIEPKTISLPYQSGALMLFTQRVEET